MTELLTAILLIIVMLIVSMVLVNMGWTLFVVPVFGLSPLTASQTIGLVLLINCFKSSVTTK